MRCDEERGADWTGLEWTGRVREGKQRHEQQGEGKLITNGYQVPTVLCKQTTKQMEITLPYPLHTLMAND